MIKPAFMLAERFLSFYRLSYRCELRTRLHRLP